MGCQSQPVGILEVTTQGVGLLEPGCWEANSWAWPTPGAQGMDTLDPAGGRRGQVQPSWGRCRISVEREAQVQAGAR